ncbi:hypothetical protein ACP4OV_028335 [Aristida adscensionis]
MPPPSLPPTSAAAAADLVMGSRLLSHPLSPEEFDARLSAVLSPERNAPSSPPPVTGSSSYSEEFDARLGAVPSPEWNALPSPLPPSTGWSCFSDELDTHLGAVLSPERNPPSSPPRPPTWSPCFTDDVRIVEDSLAGDTEVPESQPGVDNVLEEEEDVAETLLQLASTEVRIFDTHKAWAEAGNLMLPILLPILYGEHDDDANAAASTLHWIGLGHGL